MKKTVFLFLFVFNIFICAQENSTSITIVKQNGDTIREKMKIPMLKQDGIVYVEEDSFFKKLKIVDDSGKKKYTIYPNEIKEFSFLDLENVKRIYHKEPNKNQLMQLIYNGNYKLYKQFVPMTHYLGIYYYFVQPDGKPYKVGLFENNTKILLRLTQSKPELKSKIENSKTEKDMADILYEFEN